MKPGRLKIKLTESELREIINNKISEALDEETKNRLEFNHLINEDYQRVLQEEFGIRYKTRCAADDVIKLIYEKYRTNSEVTYDNNNLKNYCGIVDYDFENKEIQIKYRIINFLKPEIFNKYQDMYDLSADYKKATNTIIINIAMVNGQFTTETANNSTQHELSHIFDELKTNGHSVPDKDKGLYKMAISQYENPINDLSYELALAVYITSETEQIAMCNGLDAMFRKHPDILNNVQETNEYSFLYYLKKVITNISDYADFIVRLYKMTPERMLKRLTKAYYDYLRRIGRVIAYHKTNY